MTDLVARLTAWSPRRRVGGRAGRVPALLAAGLLAAASIGPAGRAAAEPAPPAPMQTAIIAQIGFFAPDDPASPAARAPRTAPDASARPAAAEEEGWTVTDVAVGAAVLAGAFAVGTIGAGAMSGGFVAAGAALMLYTAIPLP